jgi:phosphate:Na+ symporter
MAVLNDIASILATIVLFLYGLEHFSKTIREVGGTWLEEWLKRFTSFPIRGLFLGAGITALIQSSSAVSSMLVSLVNAGVIGFQQSLAVLLGANIGTTVTAWIVTFNGTEIAPYFILVGTLLGAIPSRFRKGGKIIFYFGFIFFAIGLMSSVIEPLKENQAFLSLLSLSWNRFYGFLIGMLMTAILQSSSVTTGLVILLSSNGMLDLREAIAIIVGANVGSTSTALIASIPTSTTARRVALANLLFNLIGAAVFLPLLPFLAFIVKHLSNQINFQVAFSHLIFNLGMTLLIFPYLNFFTKKLAPA